MTEEQALKLMDSLSWSRPIPYGLFAPNWRIDLEWDGLRIFFKSKCVASFPIHKTEKTFIFFNRKVLDQDHPLLKKYWSIVNGLEAKKEHEEEKELKKALASLNISDDTSN